MENKNKIISLSPQEILRKLKTGYEGLSEQEVERRRAKYGPNSLPQAKTDSLALIFFRQFKSPLIYILLMAALVVIFTGEINDGIIILVVIFFNATIGTIQEGKAQNTLLALKKITETEACVIRNGKEIILPDDNLVPGDVFVIREGDKIPADGQIIHSEYLKVDEAILTGESFYKNKSENPAEENSGSPIDQSNLVFKGTYAVSGTGKAVVTATGLDTFIGNISKKASLIESEMPLKKDIARLSRFIIFSVLTLCFLLVIIGLTKGIALNDLIKFVISVAVSTIPEGLPVAVTLILATGVWRMSKNNVLVKRIQAVEALGQTKVIAVDKTGTLTRNELSVRKIYSGGKYFELKNNGYEPKGEIYFENKPADPPNHPELLLAGKIAALCANAQVAYFEETKSWKISGDPVEASMRVFSQILGFHPEIIENEMARMHEVPFDYRTKIHLSLNRDGKKNFLAVAGAPENVLQLSSWIWTSDQIIKITKETRERLEEDFFRMSKEGLRVIALAFAETTKNNLDENNLPEICFAGFIGMQDSLREEAREAVEKVQSAGIRVVMITGDHAITANAIAREAGIDCAGKEIVTGEEIEKMSDKELAARIGKICVFARVIPEHKMRIIEAFKSRKEIIAMTGDGVNDTLSLAAADLGVAMGKIGTEVAKESSDIVILDDNFGSLVEGVKEGRNIFKTIKKVILYLFSTSGGELMSIFATFIIGFPLPIQAVQILWLNLVTDGFLTVALGMEPREEGLLKKEFKKSAKNLVDFIMLRRFLLMSATMMVGTLYLFGTYYQEDIVKGWTVSLTTLAAFQWFNAWNCRSETKSIFSESPFTNRYLFLTFIFVIILQGMAIYAPFMHKILYTTPLSAAEWLKIISVAFSIVVVEEIRKLVYRLRNKQG